MEIRIMQTQVYCDRQLIRDRPWRMKRQVAAAGGMSCSIYFEIGFIFVSYRINALAMKQRAYGQLSQHEKRDACKQAAGQSSRRYDDTRCLRDSERRTPRGPANRSRNEQVVSKSYLITHKPQPISGADRALVWFG